MAANRASAARDETRILVSGASGFIGTALVRALEGDGHTVIRLVRSKPRSASEVHWSPATGEFDAAVLETVDAVINLSGASTGRLPWTRAYKREIAKSRVDATTTLAAAIRRAKHPPTVLLNASAVGFYGDRPGELLTEGSTQGTGFFPSVVADWESAVGGAGRSTRIVTFRTGIVVGRGGAFTPLLALTRIGLGSRFGSGAQNWPWVSLDDEVSAIRHLLTSTLSGPVNLAGPVPATAGEITAYLAKRMKRPYLFRVPAAIIRGLLGEGGRELLLTSENVSPGLLLRDGFAFEHETYESAIDAMLASS